MTMRKLAALIILVAAAFACKKDPAVEVTASFTTNKDVFQVGEVILIENTSTVKNDILAFCRWEYGDLSGMTEAYGLDLEGVSFSQPGLYTITLTAYAEQGAGEDSYSRQVLVIDENDIPWADFSCPAQGRGGSGLRRPFGRQYRRHQVLALEHRRNRFGHRFSGHNLRCPVHRRLRDPHGNGCLWRERYRNQDNRHNRISGYEKNNSIFDSPAAGVLLQQG